MERGTPLGWVLFERFIDDGDYSYIQDHGWVLEDLFLSQEAAQKEADAKNIEFLLDHVLPHLHEWVGDGDEHIKDATDEELCHLCYALTGTNPDNPVAALASIEQFITECPNNKLVPEAAQEAGWILEHFPQWVLFHVRPLFLK